MRVLIPVDHAVGISGPHRNVVGSLNALGKRRDVDVVLLTGATDPTEPYASAPNIRVELGFQPHNPRQVLSNLWRINRAARGCDVIYVPSGLKAFLYAQTVRLGRRLVAGPNVTPVPFGKLHDSPSKLELRLLSDAWFEPSQIRQHHVREQSGVDTVQYIHHAIDLVKFSPKHRDPQIWDQYGLAPETVKILFVGRDNEKRKGVEHLLDAMELLNNRGEGRHLDFILVGRMSDQTKARVEDMPNVHLLGFKGSSDLGRLYSSADMSVVPSSWETFGFTVLEAMASGIPVIASRTASIPEILTDDTGVLLDIVGNRSVFLPTAAARLAEAITALAGDAETRRRLGTNARHRAESHFSEERLGRDLIAIFENQRDVLDTGLD